jgi:hypothetical protein
MAVANIAIRLVQKGLRVLAIDWDLEAPGLDRYFRDLVTRSSNSGGGLLDLLIEASKITASNKKPDWRDYLSSVELDNKQQLHLLTCGRQDDEYVNKVLTFDWNSFFKEADGGSFIESLREEWRAEYDVVLIDSRTGITDSGGVCTIQLPDVLVPVFTTNHQSLDGAKEVAIRAQRARQRLAYDRTPLLIFPLPSHYDGRTQYEEARQWLKTFAAEFELFYRDWLPSTFTPQQIIERTKLPYIAYFSFGESLPVLTDGISDPEGLGYAYDVAATLISGEFKNAEQIITVGLPSETPLPSASTLVKFIHTIRLRWYRLTHTIRLLWKRSLLDRAILLVIPVIIAISLAALYLYQPAPDLSGVIERVEPVEAPGGGTQVFILLSVSNRGGPTAVYGYSLRISHANSKSINFIGPPAEMNAPYQLPERGGTEGLVVQPQDAIQFKTAQAIAQGGKVSGWLRLSFPPVPGLTPAVMRQPGMTYTVLFTDITGKTYEAVYVMS